MGKNSAGKEAERARADEEARQGEIRAGTGSINKVFDKNFDKKFFQKQQTNYLDFAKPQLNKQYGEAGDQLSYDLADRGMLDSSTKGEKTADLGELYETNRQAMIGKAKEFGTDAKNNVEDARTGLIHTLQATGDAEGAAKGALNRAGALSRPPAYSPLEDLFMSFTSTLGQQAGLERSYAAGGPRPRYNFGFYGNNDSVRNT